MTYTANMPGWVYCEPDEPEWIEPERIEKEEGPVCRTCGDHGFLYAGKEPIPCTNCNVTRRADR